jgi:hypothetical protein
MKPDLYGTIIFLHAASAVLSIGPLVILMPIIKRMRGVDVSLERAYLSIINVIIRIVMHAGHVLVFSGVLLIIIGPWPWYTSWVIMTIVVMIISVTFLAQGFTKVIKRFNKPGVDKNELLRRLNKTSWQYFLLLLIMYYLMVQKPILW